ncbi:MAG: hypothetical protein ACI95X_000476, partial [Paraglaciecola sp.]
VSRLKNQGRYPGGSWCYSIQTQFGYHLIKTLYRG